MCKQHQPESKESILNSTNSTITEVKSEQKGSGFVSCGLDRSCPTNVTTHQGQGVRLDQYQSAGIRKKADKRRGQKDIDGRAFGVKSVYLDDEFEWFDLDAIRELDNWDSNDDCAIVVSHDFNAGLLFTTERQVLSKEVEANVFNPSMSKTRKGQEFEFDLFSWVNGGHGETQDEREFRERMEELEAEIQSDLTPAPPPLLQLSPSFSSSSSCSSDENECRKQNEGDDIGSFFANWLFDDSKSQ